MEKYKIPDDLIKSLDIIAELSNRLGGVPVNNDSGVKIASRALYLKIWRGHAASLILLVETFMDEADYIIRTILESSLILKCLADKPEDTILKLGSDYRCRKDSFREVAYTSPNYKDIVDKSQNKQERLRMDGDRKIQVEEWANMAELTVFYDIAYRVLSNSAHSGIGSMDKYFIVDSEGKVQDISRKPSDEDYLRSLLTLIEIMVVALDSASNIFKIDFDKEIKTVSDIIGLYEKRFRISGDTQELRSEI